MEERRSNPWPFIAAAIALMLAVVGWFAWEGRDGPQAAARTAANALPDLRPRLPEGPHMPKVPIPVPK